MSNDTMWQHQALYPTWRLEMGDLDDVGGQVVSRLKFLDSVCGINKKSSGTSGMQNFEMLGSRPFALFVLVFASGFGFVVCK